MFEVFVCVVGLFVLNGCIGITFVFVLCLPFVVVACVFV